ncbi:hypothetical protein PsYK624_060670 [Phanerochaete sordida]|uniref:Uncharacterized protein n=1 Tax=Phanerochaete sordida TaxID=48140 RepID=A0A9P3LD46_9APHY|nr:hypothetical protein PsYK624_060670 [Phanerochaete sordida]
MIICGLRVSFPSLSFPRPPSRRPSTRVLRSPTTYFCNNRKCTHANPPQAASGRFSCQGTSLFGEPCTGTYRVSSWEARTYERTVRARWAAEDIERRTHFLAQSAKEEALSDVSSASCYEDTSSSSGGSTRSMPGAGAVRECASERRRIRAVLDAWYGGDDACVVAYVKAIGRPWLLARAQKALWLEHVAALAERETALTAWLARVDASCAGEEPWSPPYFMPPLRPTPPANSF